MSKADFLSRFGEPDHIVHLVNSAKEGTGINHALQRVVTTRSDLPKEQLNKWVLHHDQNLSMGAYKNPSTDHTLGKQSVHPGVFVHAMQNHGTSEELMKLAKSDDPMHRSVAITAKNATKKHIDEVIKKPLTSPPGSAYQVSSGYHQLKTDLASAMIDHKHFPDVGQKFKVHVSHEDLAKLSEPHLKKFLTRVEPHCPVSDGALHHLLKANPTHLNTALKSDNGFDSLTHSHHILMNSPHVDHDSLVHVGKKVGQLRGHRDYDGLAVTAMRHPNITKEGAKQILDANEHNAYYDQMRNIYRKMG